MAVFYALFGAFCMLCLIGGAFFAGFIGGKLAVNAAAAAAPKAAEEDEDQKREQEKMQKQWSELFSYNGMKGGEDE